MNFKRILAIVLVSVMAVFCFASCGKEVPEITVQLKINCNDPDFPVILDIPVTIKKEAPSVLDIFTTGCDGAEMAYVLDDEGKSVVDIDVYKDYTDAETNTTYYWYYTINGKEASSGKAADNTVADGDVIEYIYVAYVPKMQ